MTEPTKYVIDPLEPFPKRWFDHIGNITVMCEPVKGYVMVRRPGAAPFVLSVREMLNTDKNPVHGPFTVLRQQRQQGE